VKKYSSKLRNRGKKEMLIAFNWPNWVIVLGIPEGYVGY
jgi:hypothetical protein